MKQRSSHQRKQKASFFNLKQFALNHLHSLWKLTDLCALVLGASNKTAIEKFRHRGYMSKLRSFFLLGEPKQLVLGIKAEGGRVESYRVATPDDAELTRKVAESYARRAINSVLRAHRVLDVSANGKLLPTATIESIRTVLPAPSQMRLPF